MVDDPPGVVKRANGETFSYLPREQAGGIASITYYSHMTSAPDRLPDPLVASAAQPSRREEPRRERATARRAPAPSPSTRARSGARASTRRTVLVVDDAPDPREMYGSYLGYRGFGVLTAPDGDAAVETALAQVPDVIVMDLAMPRLNGISAVHRLKLHPRTRNIPVIILTGYAFRAIQQGALEAGADVFLTKPCLPEDLERHVQHLLERRA
jgi:two-component system cell cycle response regulator DivK